MNIISEQTRLRKQGLIVLLAALLLGSLQACTLHNASHPSMAAVPRTDTSVYMDLAVGQEIQAEESASVLFGFLTISSPKKLADGVVYGAGEGSGLFGFVGGGPAEDAKAGAAYAAVKSAGADYIVNPRYELETKNYFIFKKVRAKVKGFAGKIQKVTPVPMDTYFRMCK